MKIAFFSTHKYEVDVFHRANSPYNFEFTWLEAHLTPQTAELASGHDVVCAFVEDQLNREVISILKEKGIRLIALRSAGFNHVDMEAAKEMGISVVRVPEYSPHAIAEHAVALILNLNRRIHRSYQRVRELNFSLEGLVGFDLYKKTVGVIGTGKIGAAFSEIMLGFGCQVLASDMVESEELKAKGVTYTDFDTILAESDIISLHIPLTPNTHHLIDAQAIKKMKAGVLIINTGRGGLIETSALTDALKGRRIGGAGLDVYEEEEGVFFHDLSEHGLQDDTLARLLTFPNVLITSHQAFLTHEALNSIAETTLYNVDCFRQGKKSKNEV